jgi:hypothetical protein
MSQSQSGGFVVFLVSYFGIKYLFGPATCNDGWHSPSIGKQGACSWHGGVNNTPELVAFCVSAILGFVVYVWLKLREEQKRKPLYQALVGDKGRPTYDGPRCPLCNSEMRIRVAKKGLNKGGIFFGCTRFPHCRGTSSHGQGEV